MGAKNHQRSFYVLMYMETHNKWVWRLIWGASYLGSLFGMSFVTMAFARQDSALSHIDTTSVRVVKPGTATKISLTSAKKGDASASGSQTANSTEVKKSNSSYKKGGEKYEQAVSIIKKYEGLHGRRHWPLIGYGHMVQPGEKYSRGVVLSESEADALLRKDLDKFIALYKDVSDADALLLAVLSYNIGPGNVKRSNVYARLKSGNRNIESDYLAHSRYRGKRHAQIYQRRQEELSELFSVINVTSGTMAGVQNAKTESSAAKGNGGNKKTVKSTASVNNSTVGNNVTTLQ